MVQALFHDMGEIVTGDLPHPVKKDHPKLAAILNNIQDAAHLRMCIPWGLPAPAYTDPDAIWAVKIAEMIETLEFSLQEIVMGNRLAELPYTRNLDWLISNLQLRVTDPPIRIEIAERALYYIMKRIDTWTKT